MTTKIKTIIDTVRMHYHDTPRYETVRLLKKTIVDGHKQIGFDWFLHKRPTGVMTKPEPATDSEVRPRKKVVHTCHECGKPGHNLRTCLARPAAVDRQIGGIPVGIMY